MYAIHCAVRPHSLKDCLRWCRILSDQD